MTDGIQRWRLLVKSLQAVVVLGVPFISINGNSLLRFDVPSLTLFIAGAAVGMDEFFIVLIVVLFLSFLIITLTILLGRIWCGWFCPQTVIVEFTGFVDRMWSAGTLYRIASLLVLLGISIVVSASLIWYFVTPYEFAARAIRGNLGSVIVWSWSSLTVVTFLNILLFRRRFCATVCPYAKIQGAIYDDRTLVIAADPDRMDECMRCDACIKVCPVHIDIRNGPDMACVNCAECIDACAGRMKMRKRTSLIGYRFGMLNKGASVFRKNVLLAGGTTLFLLILLFVLFFSRTMMDFELIADSQLPPRITGDGRLLNSYILTVTNRTDREQELTIVIRSPAETISASPDRVTVGPHEHRRVKLAALSGQIHQAHDDPVQIYVSVISTTDSKNRFQQQTTFFPPW